ncbi:MAG: ribosome hibernation-promoting factor, HPF/YfiA family [Chitinophagales bacterium]
MDILTHAHGITIASTLQEFITKKVSKLETFVEKLTTVDVYLKLENHSQVKDKTTEIKINVPGQTLFATETAKTFEEATDSAVDSLVRQIKKYKAKENRR